MAWMLYCLWIRMIMQLYNDIFLGIFAIIGLLFINLYIFVDDKKGDKS